MSVKFKILQIPFILEQIKIYVTKLFEIQYFGNINYYSALINSKDYEIHAYEPFRKMSFMNRCRILGANGPIDLTIPVVGGREVKLPVRDIKISYKEDWRSQHYRSLVSAYNRSPWFFQFEPMVRDLYAKKFEYLFEMNIECHKLVYKFLGEQILDFEDKLIADDNSSELEPVIFLPRNPNPLGREFPKYLQVFSDRFDFVPDLSVLDLIFCEGPNARVLLEMAAKKA